MAKTTQVPILFSGIQPTGSLTIGNYIGAIKQWVQLQSQYQCMFALVDLHALTVRQDPAQLKRQCYDMLALLIACGIDPEQHIVYIQSHVPAHCQLTWLLNCYTYYGELTRMTQFKDKAKRQSDNINVGLFDYPVLMASDILLYQTDLVPVGDDQKQHLELTCTLAERFNYYYGQVFKIPQPFIPQSGSRIMSLQNPETKMSKSEANENAYIRLLDEPETVKRKVKRAVTDSGREIRYQQDKPGISNLLTLYAAVTDQTIDQLELAYTESGYGPFKKDLGEKIANFLEPIQKRYDEWRADETKLDQLLKTNARKAQRKARPTLNAAYRAAGLIT